MRRVRVGCGQRCRGDAGWRRKWGLEARVVGFVVARWATVVPVGAAARLRQKNTA